MKNSFVALIFIFLTLFYYNGFAENRAGAITLTLGGGYEFFSSSRHIRNTGVPNLALAYNFTERWAVEGLVGYLSTVSRPDTHEEVRGWLYLVDAIYRFTPKKWFVPYALFGLGATGLKPSGVNPTQQANMNAGIGAQLFADRSLAARIEIRDIYSTVRGQNDVLVNAGVSFLFMP